MVVETTRLILELTTDEYMERMISEEKDEGMKIAYSEMLEGVKLHPNQREWNAVWLIKLKELPNVIVGDMCFKGLNENGMIEIGYGIKPEYQGNGYMTEAVSGIAKWASEQEEIKCIEAEADPDNIASHRVLEKAGFTKNGVIGKEGPRFVYRQ